jgi:predicted O-linked N-acetylglucosamine transferase (SPINDLY family)
LIKLGCQAEATACLERVLAIDPRSSEAILNLGHIEYLNHNYDRSLQLYDELIKITPDSAEAYNNRGIVLKDLGRLEEALASYDKALSLKPDYAEAYKTRGAVLRDLKRLDEALASYEKALSLNPELEFLFGVYLHTKMQLCDWGYFNNNLTQLIADVEQSRLAVSPFILLGLIDQPALQNNAAKTYSTTQYPKRDALGPFVKRPLNEKVRIGYYSADFQTHATAYLIAELFEVHDHDRYELYGFSFGPSSNDEMRRRIVSAFDRFIEVNSMSDRQIAQLSRDMGVDIAVDLKGYTQHGRTGIFAEGAAPIQVNYLGYPGTMGAEYMDYIIADKTLIPEQYQSEYTEKIVYLPGSYQVNDSKRRISGRQFSRQELGLPESGFVFCCFNNNYKIQPQTFDGWIRILKAVEGSALWLFENSPAVAVNLRREAEARGLDGSRLIFAKQMPLEEHLARQRLADLFLDTLPYNAHTTTSDALWAGLPVLTCAGKSFASRVAASLLNALDLPELITHSQEEYEDRAVELATNPSGLQAIKNKLERNRLVTSLFDSKRFARHIEAAYEIMYARYQSGLPPEPIEVRS